MSYEVRQSVIEDIPAILEELKSFSDLYKTKLPMYRDDETSEAIIKEMVEKHLFYTAAKDGAVVGFVAGFISNHIYNPDIKVLTEAFWWTKPEHRKSGVGLMLLDKFVAYGKKHSDWIITTIEDDTPVDESLFIDRGFRMKEKSYIMEVN